MSHEQLEYGYRFDGVRTEWRPACSCGWEGSWWRFTQDGRLEFESHLSQGGAPVALDLAAIKAQVASEHYSYQWVVTTIVPLLVAEIERLRAAAPA